MNLWQQFYLLIWLAFLQIIIMVVLPPVIYILALHILLGLTILGLAHYDSARIRNTQAPDRLKRIVKSTSILATVQPVLGVLLYLEVTYFSSGIFDIIIRFLHVTVALAIIAQASSVATAYDMWEEHEYATAAPPTI